MGRKKKEAKQIYERILPFLLPVLLILIWSLWTLMINPETILPSPVEVFIKLVSEIGNTSLNHMVLITLKLGITGILIGGLFGFLLGIVNSRLRLADLCFHPTIHIFRNVPMIAVFMVIMLLGMSEKAVITLVVLEVFFPAYSCTYKGIKAIDNKLIEMGKVSGFSRFTIFKVIILPVACFSVIKGIKQALRSLWTLLISIYLIILYQYPDRDLVVSDIGKSNQLEQMIIGIFLYILLCKLVYGIIEVFERKILSWREV